MTDVVSTCVTITRRMPLIRNLRSAVLSGNNNKDTGSDATIRHWSDHYTPPSRCQKTSLDESHKGTSYDAAADNSANN